MNHTIRIASGILLASLCLAACSDGGATPGPSLPSTHTASSVSCPRVAQGPATQFVADISVAELGPSSGGYLVEGASGIYFRSDTRGVFERVDLTTDGEEPDAPGQFGSMSWNGSRIAFISEATSFDPNVTAVGASAISVALDAGFTARFSLGADEGVLDDTVFAASVSLAGNAFFYETAARNASEYDSGGYSQIYGLWVGEPQFFDVVSKNDAGDLANGDAWDASASTTGRYVAFTSQASNLDAASQAESSQVAVYLRDVAAATTTLVSSGFAGGQANGPSVEPAISGDGRFVAYVSAATDIVPGDENGKADVYLWDREAATTTLVTATSEGCSANGDASNGLLVTADGKYVIFGSNATNLAGVDGANGAYQIYIYDTASATTTLLSQTSDLEAGLEDSLAVASYGARFVVVLTESGNLVDQDADVLPALIVFDLVENTSTRVA